MENNGIKHQTQSGIVMKFLFSQMNSRFASVEIFLLIYPQVVFTEQEKGTSASDGSVKSHYSKLKALKAPLFR